MHRRIRRGAIGLASILLTVGLGAGPWGCRTPLDRVYALPLEQEPSAADWDAAVAMRFQAAGGRTSQQAEADVDRDAVHASTASCHHGTQAPPVEVEVRAFHTADRLYLRVEWQDPTADRGPLWSWNGTKWEAAGFREDGLGVLWGPPEGPFQCSRACHLEDWRMAGPRAFADYRMASPPGWDPLDLWIWRAGRGTLGGDAEDVTLGPDGIVGDGDERAPYVPNSRIDRSGTGGNAFGPDDAPWEASQPEPGAQVPGYLRGGAGGGVEGRGVWKDGIWKVTLSRTLAAADSGDVGFRPGDELAFGLAILDGVEKDHNAVPVPIRVRLVGRDALAALNAGDEE